MADLIEESEAEHDQDSIHDQTTVQTNHRHSERIRTLPKHLEDYEVDLPPSITVFPSDTTSGNSVLYPISNFISYDKFSPSHKAFLVAISSRDEPKNFKQAVSHEHWRGAMRREIAALESNGTWSLEDLPTGRNTIDSKWIYKIKYKPNGDIERYKARLVGRGFTQIKGEDFHETFAPVAKLVTIRCLLTVAVKKGWIIHQLDVNNAFLHGDLAEEIYMKIP